MKILLFGGQGMLGQEIFYALQDEYEVIPLSRYNVDIKDFVSVNEIVSQMKPDIIINTVAINQQHVAKGLTEDEIFQVNTAGAVHVAMSAREHDIPLIHFSCCAVLGQSAKKDIKATMKVTEKDLVALSKKEAEESIIKTLKQGSYIIIRTGILFGQYGYSVVNNFSRLVQKHTKIEVLNHLISLTSTSLVVDFLKEIFLDIKNQFQKNAVIHCAYQEKLSYAQLLQSIAEIKNKKVEIKENFNKEEFLDLSLEPSYQTKRILQDDLKEFLK